MSTHGAEHYPDEKATQKISGTIDFSSYDLDSACDQGHYFRVQYYTEQRKNGYFSDPYNEHGNVSAALKELTESFTPSEVAYIENLEKRYQQNDPQAVAIIANTKHNFDEDMSKSELEAARKFLFAADYNNKNVELGMLMDRLSPEQRKIVHAQALAAAGSPQDPEFAGRLYEKTLALADASTFTGLRRIYPDTNEYPYLTAERDEKRPLTDLLHEKLTVMEKFFSQDEIKAANSIAEKVLQGNGPFDYS